MSAIDVSSYVGLLAMGMLTVNILLGLLLSTRYNPMKQWPHRKIPIFQIHNWNGYLALAVAFLHPVILMFNPKLAFRFVYIFYPLLYSPPLAIDDPRNLRVAEQTFVAQLCFGSLALYLLTFVLVTSYFRPQLGNRRWKKLHFFTYALAVAFYFHSITINPDWKVGFDPLDGEKLLIEGCALLVVVGIVWRVWRGSGVKVGPTGK
jgi:predicted ferric reductase